MTNYTEIIAKTAEAVNVTKKDCREVVDALVKAITDEVVAGNDVKISGLGTLKCVEVPERRGTIMMGDRKGEEYVTPAHADVKMKLAKTIRDAVKNA